jgi:hypothetical protein
MHIWLWHYYKLWYFCKIYFLTLIWALILKLQKIDLQSGSNGRAWGPEFKPRYHQKNKQKPMKRTKQGFINEESRNNALLAYVTWLNSFKQYGMSTCVACKRLGGKVTECSQSTEEIHKREEPLTHKFWNSLQWKMKVLLEHKRRDN